MAAQFLPVSLFSLLWRTKTTVVAEGVGGGGGHSGADLPTAVSVVGTRAPSPCCVTLRPPQAFSGAGGGPGQHLPEAEAIETLNPVTKTENKRHTRNVLATRWNRWWQQIRILMKRKRNI